MLQPFSKYLISDNNAKIINLNCDGKLFLYSKSVFYNYTSFFRKFYFRTLLAYINILYSNINCVNEYNYFYTVKQVIANNTNIHKGFLFKK